MRTRSPRRHAPALGFRDSRAAGFTLVEMLVVIAILSLLAGILFPILATARGKAREIACLSNVRHAGLAISMYAQDYDGYYPVAVDPADRDTPQIWNSRPDFKAQIPSLPWLHEVLQPYIKSRDMFHCPADSGIVIEDFTGLELGCLPTCFGKYGTSYLYRTEIAARHLSEAGFQTPALANVLMEGSGIWHGSGPDDHTIGVANWTKSNPALFQRRFNTLHGDGHAKSLLFQPLQGLWNTPL